jgi:hypothetical protein
MTNGIGMLFASPGEWIYIQAPPEEHTQNYVATDEKKA